MEAQGTCVLFYSGVGSVLSQQHRLATSSLFFVCPQSVKQEKNGAKIGHGHGHGHIFFRYTLG